MKILLGGTKDDIFSVSTGESIAELYNNPIPTENSIKYNPKSLLDKEQCYYLEDFSKKKYGSQVIRELISDLKNTKSFDHSYPQLKSNQFNKITYLIFNDGEKLYFEKITPSKRITKKIIDFSGDAIVENKKLLVMQDRADAMYDAEQDKLFFFKLENLKRMFPEVEELYREATKEEIEEFANLDIINFSDDLIKTKIGVQNRKRIASFLDKWKDVAKEKLLEYIEYAEKFNLPVEDKKLKVDSEKALKEALYLLDERYFKTEISNKPKIANSIQELNSDK